MNVKEVLWLKHLKRPMYRSLFPHVLRISKVLNLDRTSSCLQQVTPREAVQTYQKSISFEFQSLLDLCDLYSNLTLYIPSHDDDDDDDDDDDEHFMIQHPSLGMLWFEVRHLGAMASLAKLHIALRGHPPQDSIPAGCLPGLRLRICDQT